MVLRLRYGLNIARRAHNRNNRNEGVMSTIITVNAALPPLFLAHWHGLGSHGSNRPPTRLSLGRLHLHDVNRDLIPVQDTAEDWIVRFYPH